MEERRVLEGTIVGVNNKVSTKGQPYTVYKMVTLEGAELSLYKWENNLNLLNKVVKCEIETTEKNEKQYNTVVSMVVIQK